MRRYIGNIINTRKIQESKEKCFDSIIQKYPDKVLVYVTLDTTLEGKLPKDKFLVPKDVTFGDFCVNLKKYITLGSAEGLCYFIGDNENVIPRMNENINYIYQKHKSSNGVLYLVVCRENVFGK